MTMLHDELCGTCSGNDLLHLFEIDQEGAMAAHHHGISMQLLLNLFGGGT